MTRGDLPIGVLDSGLGGLSLVKALARILPSEALVYLGDTAQGPYGAKSAETLERCTLRAGAALLRHTPKLLVIACDAMSAHGLAALQAVAPCPVIGVIESGACAASAEPGPIGLIGSQAAIQSGRFEEAILRNHPKAVIHPLACPLLSSLAGEGWVDDPITDAICRRYLNQIPFEAHAVLVGNADYVPLLPSLARIRANTRWLDAAALTAHAAERLLQGGLGFRTAREQGSLRILLTDVTPALRSQGEGYLGAPLEGIECVTL